MTLETGEQPSQVTGAVPRHGDERDFRQGQVTVSTIIVNFNGHEMVVEAARSVARAYAGMPGAHELIVVDNASSDGSADRVMREVPSAVLVRNAENKGFAGGVNAGLAVAAGDWIFLLNNDAYVDTRCVAALLERIPATDRQRLGALAPQVRFAAEPATINSAGLAVDRLGIAFDRKVGRQGDGPGAPDEQVFGVSGGAALLRREMLADTGGFDGSYFMFYEDADLAWRARSRGWTTLYVPDAVAFHHHSSSVGHGSPRKDFLVGRNRVRTLAKNATTRHLAALRRADGAVRPRLLRFRAGAPPEPRPAAGPARRPQDLAVRPPGGRPARRRPARAGPGASLGAPPARRLGGERDGTIGAGRALSASFAGRRVAIVHDWFQGFHGSERVVEAMATDVFADAAAVDILTFSAAREILPDTLNSRIRKVSAVSTVPGIRQREHAPGRWRWFLPYMPRYFAGLDLSGYDIVVSSSHSCAVNVRPPAEALHVCYCYTPMRYAWFGALERERVTGPQAVALRALSAWFRRVDYAAAQRVDAYCTLSSEVRRRIAACYGRDAELIFPPVDTHDFRPADRGTGAGRFLWVHRMVPYKQPLVVARAFAGLPQRLTMVGVGPLHEQVKQEAPGNVTVHGWLDRGALADLYAEASGFIHIGEEDFGITMVEALASGLPVIALSRGGARDIVRDGVDGVLIDRADEESLRGAIERCAATEWDPESLAARAERFSRATFVREARAFVARKAAEKRALRDGAPG